MERPQPKKHAECEQCLREKPLLMPVSWIPGWPMVVWSLLCLDCRTSSETSRHWSRYGCPGYRLEHSHDAAERETFQEWLKVESL